MSGTERTVVTALLLALCATVGLQARAARGGERAETRLVLASVAPEGTPEADVVEIELSPEAFRKLWDIGRATVEDFPLPGGQRVDLNLRPFQVLAPNAVVINVDEDGEEVRDRPEIRFVRGTVDGDVDSSVVLGLFQNRISGVVKTRDQEFGVGPHDFSIDGPKAMEIHVWDRTIEHGEWDCAVTDENSSLAASIIDFEAIAEEAAASRSHLGGAQLRLDLAVDSTTEWCAHFGDDSTAAQNYLLTAIAQISAIYDAEILEIVEVVFLRTFCGSADPYTDGLGINDRSQLLSELTTEWTTNQGGVSRTVAHLFSKSDVSASGGLANTVTCSGPSCQSVLCNTASGYGVTLFPASGGAPAGFEVSVAAHELGHNHSSPHTNCLQDGGGDWLSTCAINSCSLNPWCQATGCFPGPVDPNMTGTLMSTQCNSRVSVFDDNIVETILRTSAEAASCIGAAGLPAESLGLTVSPVQSCPNEILQNDDNSIDSGLGGPATWVKRFTPGCVPFQLTGIDTIIPAFGALVGRPIRIMIYTDPSGSGNPANASLVYTEDTTVQVVSFSVFNEYTLSTPVTLSSGDFYIGFFDPVGDGEFIISEDSSFVGDSYNGFSTDPAGFNVDPGHTYMIRGEGGPVPAGSLLLSWDLPCNDLTTPGQDFAVYRGDIGSPGVYTNLTCTTNRNLSYFAESPPDASFFVVVPHTSPSEGSYGKTSAGVERPAASGACKAQNLEGCP